MASIFDSLKGMVTPDLIAQAASTLGEDKSNVTKAVGAAVPSILGSILAKGNDSGLESVLKKAGDSNSNILGNITDIFSGKSDKATEGVGSGLLDSILGGSKLGGLTSLISTVSGISGSSSSGLLSMLTPIIGGFLGKKMSTEGLNLSGLLGVLNTEKSGFMSAIPSGLTGVLGLSSLAGLGSNLTNSASSTVKAVADDVSGAAGKAKGGISSILKWLIPLLVILGLVLFAWKSCDTDKTKKDVQDTTAAVVADTKATVDNAVDKVTDKVSRIAKDFKLPNGISISAFEGGIESQMIDFLGSDAFKTASADQLKEKWFNFDNINFEFGSSTQLTAESAQQVDNVVAIIKHYGDTKVKIGAYTDKKGSADTNLKISQERANTIKKILTEKGVGAQIVGAEGYGDKFAKVSADASDEERASDRKIALRFEK